MDDLHREYEAAAADCALALLPDRGILVFGGKDAPSFLHRISTQAVQDLRPGAVRPACLTDPRARIVDRLVLFRRAADLVALTGPGRAAAVLGWVRRFALRDDLGLEDRSGAWSVASLFGPRSGTILRGALGVEPPAEGAFLLAGDGPLAPLLWRAEPVAGLSFGIFGEAAAVERILSALRTGGAADVSAEAWDLCRIEWGVPLAGSELTDEVNPMEAGLEDSYRLDKGCYIGQEVLLRLRNYGSAERRRRLARLLLEGDVPAPRTAVTREGRPVGTIASAARRPSDGKVVALAFVVTREAPGGAEVESAGARGTVLPEARPREEAP